MELSEAIDRLYEIQEDILDLAREALDIIREHNKGEYERAKSYWYPEIVMALSNEHSYLGRSMCTLQSSIEVLERGVSE